jgi:hypothetical protein
VEALRTDSGGVVAAGKIITAAELETVHGRPWEDVDVSFPFYACPANAVPANFITSTEHEHASLGTLYRLVTLPQFQLSSPRCRHACQNTAPAMMTLVALLTVTIPTTYPCGCERHAMSSRYRRDLMYNL